MKKYSFFTVSLLFIIFFFNQKAEAQNATWNYSLVTTASAPVDMTGATYFASGGDDKVRTDNFPFTFQVYDDVYSTSDIMKLSTNGFLMFNGDIYNNTRYVDTIPTNYSASKYVKGEFISYGGYGDGQITSDTIFQKITGTAPNRVYTLQFVYTPYYSNSYRATIQISLFESSNKIAINYSDISGTFSGAHVGDHIGINAGVGNFGTRTGNLPTLSTRFVFTPGANVDGPNSLTANTATSSKIDLSFVKNASANDVIITWNSVNDFDAPITGTVYTTGDEINPGKGTVLYQGAASPQSHTSLSPNTKYYYQAWSKKSTNLYSTDYEADSATTYSVIDPSNLTATAVSKSQINLSWSKNASNEDVIILWNTTNSFGNLIDNHTYVNGDNVIGGGKVLDQGSFTSKSHTGLNTNTTYYYKVWSYNSQHYYSSPGVAANETTLPPSDPTNLSATASSCKINVNWTKTDGNDVLLLMNTTNTFGTPLTGTSYALNDNIAGGGTVISVGSATSVEESPLDNGIHHYYKAFSFDGVYNYSNGVTDDVTTTDVNNVTALSATSSNYQIDLSWTQNSATDDVIVLWNSTNTFGSLTDGTTYNVNDAIAGGGTVLAKGPLTTKSHTGLTAGTTYYYKVFSFDCGTTYSGGQVTSGTTLSMGNPTNFTATATATCNIDLSWVKDGTNDVMVVYNTTNNFGTPFNGYPYYTVGTQVSPNHDTVLYIGSASNVSHSPIVDGQKFYYKAYSYNSSYHFSSGVAADDSTAVIADPSNLSSTSGSSSIDLTYNLNSAGNDVIILSNTTNTFGTLDDGQSYTTGATLGAGLGKIIYQGTSTSFTDAGLTLNTEYFYKIQSFDCAKNYSIGKLINDTTESVSAPSNFIVNSVSASQIDLSWSKNSSGEDVIITRNLTGTFTSPNDGTPYYQNGSIGTDYVIYKGSASYVSDNLLNPSTTYYYKIWSVSSTNYYSSGLESNATTDGILNPDTFYAKTFSNSQINLSWNANANSDSVMIVYNTVDIFAQPTNGTVYPVGNQIAAGQGRVVYRGNSITDTSFSHVGLTASTKYYYKIWSYDNSSNYYSSPGLKDTAWTMAPGIVAFPHIEDFETQVANTGSISGCQTTFNLTTSWTNTQSGDQIDWVARQGGTTSFNTGPDGDNTLADHSGTYLYTEASACYSKEAWLLSPIYNFTNLTGPQLQFYYHMYGSAMGQLSVQVSADGGLTWGSDLFYKTGQQQSSNASPYSQALVNLGAYAGMTDIRIRIKGKTGVSYTSDIAIDDIKVFQPTPMYITSVTTEQDTLPVVQNMVKQGIIRVKVNTIGDYSFLTLSSLELSTNGTQDLTDIENARVYYTGSNPDFATNDQLGNVVISPNSSFSITGSKVLAEGDNYFWLAYDIKPTATMGNVVDASCTKVTISSVDYIPTITSPIGTKTIVGQITMGPGGNSSNTTGPVYSPYYAGANESVYSPSEMGSGQKEITQIAWNKVSGLNITDNIDPIKVYVKNSNDSTISSGSYSLTAYTLVYTGPMPNNKVSGWMKIPLSTPFLYDGVSSLHVLVTHDRPAVSWNNDAFYSYSVTSDNRNRGDYDWNTSPTYLYESTSRPDIQFQYLLPAPMVYVSSSVFQAETKNVGVGSSDKKIIGIKVITNHTGNPLDLTNLVLSTNGSTLASDILNANVYYTGSNPNFTVSNKFGSTVATPNGSFSITGTQTLSPGENYFWLAYDISSSAVVNDVVDAECTSITVDGATKIPNPTSAIGSRTIKKYIIIGNITSVNSDSEQPLHYYQDHGWEAIYKSTELGAAKDLTALAFYKKSGSNTVNDILNVSIYIKHTSSSSLTTGAYSTNGYTLVYNGSFPNNDVSGWMQVEFNSPFAYNGTDNIEVLILQDYGAYFGNYPLWSYNTTTTDRARYASSWSGIPNSLTASNKLANIRFEYEPPMPMTYISSNTTQLNITNVYSGLVDQEIIGIQVVTDNSLSPLEATNFLLNTTGSTDAIGDILNAKIYYTGNSSTFATTNLFGDKINPFGSFSIAGNQSLVNGINYFWLTYDIQSTATVGNHVDAECNSITISSDVKIPTITNPPGNRTIVGALSGYYTIGTTGDYSTFASAITALNTFGVSDWVTFQVQSGTYNEKISLGTVNGVSASRPITFESLSGDSTDVILTNGTANWGDAATIKIVGNYYVIKNMTVKATGNYGNAIEIANGADNNIVRNNVLISNATTFNEQGAVVYANQLTQSNTRIVQNKVEGNNYGIYLSGGWTINASGWEIDSNTIVSSEYGVYFSDVKDVKVRYNTMTIGASSTDAYGLFSEYGAGGYSISENKIVTTASDISVGIYSYLSSATSSNKDIIYNNFIANTANSSTRSSGVQLTNCNYIDVLYNNINITSTSIGSSRSAVDIQNSSDISLKNNNLIAAGGGYAQYIGSSADVSSSNYNNMYSTGNIGYYDGSDLSNLAAWKTATSMDANSVSMDPSYTSTTDLHVSNSLLDNKGTPIVGIDFDIDGAARNSVNPDIGADEFGIGVIDAGISAITSPSISTCGSGLLPVKVDIKNYGNTTLTSATVSWKVGGVSQTNYSWTGSIAAGTSVNVTVGSYNFGVGNIAIEAWTSSPNGIVDQYPSNDTSNVNVEIGDTPIVYAGADTTVCTSAYNITDASSVNHNYLLWTTSGSGIVAGQNTITPTYMPSTADYSAGSVYLKLTASSNTCSDSEDSVLVTLSQPPTVTFTGLASTYCTSDVATSLVGSPSGGIFSGDGVVGNTFDPATAIIGTNTVKYTYTSGICTDSAIKTTVVGNAPIAFAGNDTTLCGDSVIINTATATNYNTLLWTTTGSGVFVNEGTINPTYKPSTADYSAGSVNLVLTAIGSCSTVSDTFLLTIFHFPTVSFSGLAATYCSSDAASVLVGSPNGGTFSGDGVVGSTFDPSTAIIGNNSVKYVYSNGTCSDSSIQTTVVSAPPTIFAGDDTTLCANYYINSTAIASNYTSLVWTSSGSGSYDNSSLLASKYTPSTADFAAGSIYLKLSATSSCSVVEDSFLLNISSPPTVSFTGLALNYCNTDAAVTLTGNPTGGIFSGDAISGSTFNPSNAIIGVNKVKYTYTIGICTDSAIQNTTVSTVPIVFAGNDTSVCANSYTVPNASATSYGSLQWSTSGGGTFTDGNTLVSTYYPSAADYTAGSVYLRLTALGSCSNVVDSLLLTINQPPSVTFTGLATQYCANDDIDTLVGTPSGGTFIGTAMTSNYFNPSNAIIGSNTIKYAYSSGACTDTAEATVVVNSNPTVTLSGLLNTYCSNDAIVTLVGSPVGGSFSGAGVSGNTFDPSSGAITSPTSVYYSYTDGSTSCSNVDTQNVVVNPVPTANAGADKYISTFSSTTLNGSASGGTGSYAYSWSPTNKIASGSTTLTPTTTNLFSTQAYDFTVTDANNCSGTDQVKVFVNIPFPVLNITSVTATPNVVCFGDSTHLEATVIGVDGTTTFSWTSNPAGFTSSEKDVWIHPTQSAWYKLYVTKGSLNDEDSVYVTVNPLPNVSFTGLPNSICTNEDSVHMIGTPSNGTYSGSGVVSEYFYPANAGAGIYDIVYSSTDANSCTNTDTQTVIVNAAPIANAGIDQPITSGNSATLSGSASGGTGVYSYVWSPAASIASGVNSAIATTNPLTNSLVFVLNVTDANSCSDEDNMFVSVGNAMAATVTASPDSICLGSSSQLSAIVGGGNGTYTYSWTSVPIGFTSTISNPVVSPTVTTLYNVEITDGTDTINSNASVYVGSLPIANAGSDQTIASGATTTLNGSATGGTGSYSYSWTPISDLVNANVQNPITNALTVNTTFTLNVSDAIGCTANDDMTVNISSTVLSVSTISTPDTICEGESSQLQAIAIGGSGTYTYSWSSTPSGFASTLSNPVVSPTTTTTYTVVANDGLTTSSSSVVVTVNAVPNTSFNGLNNNYCNTDAAVTLSGLPVGGSFSGNGITGNQFNPNDASVIIGSNQVIYSVTQNGCTNADTQYVAVHETPIANAGSDITMAPGSTTLNGSYTGGSDVGYFWTPSSKLLNANIAAPTTISLNSSTVFSLETRDTVSGCSSTDDMTVSIIGVPLSVVASSNTGIICAGDTLYLSSLVTGGNSGVYSYLWSSSPSAFSSTVANPQAYPTVNTTYTVRVIDGTDTATANTSVIVNPLPSVSFVGLGNKYCNNNSSVSLAGTPSGGIFSGNGIVGNQFDPSQAGIGQNTIVYTVTVNSCTNSDSQNVSIVETPIANAGIDIIMAPGDTILNGSYSGGNDVGYFWTPTNKLISSNIANPHTVVLSNTETYYLETKDTVNGCLSTDDVTVTVTGGAVSIVATASPSTICAGDTSYITTIVSGGNGTYSYMWTSIPTGFTSTQANISVSPNDTTSYFVYVTSGSSTDNSNATINVNPVPTVTFSGLTTPVCSDANQMILVGSPSGGVFTGTGVISASGSYKFDASIAGTGNWNVVYSYTDANTLCTSADTQIVGVNPVPIVNAGPDDIISQNTTATLSGSATGAANYKYSWSPSSMVVNANAASTQTIALTNSQPFTLQVEDSVTTCSSSDVVNITVSSSLPVSASATASPTTICNGESSQLDVIASGGSGIYTYSWTSVPSGFTSTIKNPVVNPSLTTAYSVVVTDGSTSTNTSVTITVKASPVASISGLDTSYCNNGVSDTLQGIPAGGFFNGNGITSNLFNPIVAGVGYHTIIYSYTASNGCTDTDTLITHVYSAPIANAGTDFTITAPSTATLSASASGGSNNYNYSWSPAALFTNANMQNVTTTNDLALTTSFTVEVSDLVSQCKNSDNVVVTVIGGPLTINPTATPDTICKGEQIQLNAFVGGGSGNLMIAWTSLPSGYIQTIANPVASPTVTTQYILNVYDVDNSVSISDTIIVVVGAIPTVNITSTTTNYCSNGNNETLLATPTGGIFYGNGISANVFSPNLAGIGSHQIIYNYTSPLGCSNSDTISVNVDQAPIADAGSDITISCNSGGGLIGSSAVGNMTYSWTPSNTLAQPTASQTIATPSVNTIYTVLVTNTITNCTNTDDVMVNVTGGPTLSVTNDTIICGGGSVTISANSNATSFIWSNGVTSSSFTASPTTSTVYTITVTDASTCSAVDSVVVGVHSPYVNLGPDITVIDTQIVLLDAGYGFNSYAWNTGSITQFIEVRPYVNSQLGINKYVVEVADNFGCSARDSVLINYVLGIEGIDNNLSFSLYPNPTDGKFILKVEGTISEKYSLEIVNMQSQLLLEKEIDISSTKYSESIDLSTWPKGIYLVRLKSKNYFSTRKLIIK